MNKKKIIKSFAITGCTAATVAAIIPLSVMLTSCHSTKTTPEYSYNVESKTLNLNSSVLFGSHNIFYGFQKIRFDSNKNFVNDGTPFNLIDAINKAIPNNNYFNEYSSVDYDSTKANGFSLSVPLTSTNPKENIPVTLITINFPTIKEKDISYRQPIVAQASMYFPNQPLSVVQTYSANKIIGTLGQSIIPVGTLISEDNKQIINNGTNKELIYTIFIPSSGVSHLILNFNPIKVPNVNPQNNIKDLNIDNDWEQIVNWSPDLPSSINYNTINNPTGESTIFAQPIKASYDDALHGKNLLDKFNSVYFDGNSNEATQEINSNNLNLDVNYFIKTYIASVVSSWNGQNILNSNIYTGNNLKITKNTVSGNIVIQLQNLSGSTQELSTPISKEKISIPNKGIVSLVIKFDNSHISPFLLTKSKRNDTAYLTTAFNNVSLNVMVNNVSKYSQNWLTPVNIFQYSYALKTLVNNVVEGQTYLDVAPILTNAQSKITNNDLKQSIADTLQSDLNKFNVLLTGVEGLFTSWAKNPTICDWLQSIGPYLYDILISTTGNESLSSLISNLFTTRTISNFLFFNWRNLVDILLQLNIPSIQTEIDALIKLVVQIGQENKTLPEMENWVKNVGALYSTLEKLFTGNDTLKWLLPMVKHAMFSLQENPSFIVFLFENLPVVIKTLGTSCPNSTVKTIFTAIGNWVTELVSGSDKLNGTNSKPTPEDNSSSSNDDNSSTNVPDNMDLNKVLMNIRTLDPKLIANGNDYTSLFTYLGNAIGGKAKQILCGIGSVFNAISFSGLNAKQIQNCVNAFFTVTVNGKQMDLIQMLATNLNVVVNNSDFAYDPNTKIVNAKQSWTISFKNTVSWQLQPVVDLLNNLRFDQSKLDIKDDKGNNLIPEKIQNILKTIQTATSAGIIGSVICPKTLVVSPKNSVTLSYVANNSNVTPYVDKYGSISFRYHVDKYVQINTGDIIKDSKANNIFIFVDAWHKIMNLLTTKIINWDGSYKSSQWIYSKPVEGLKIDNFESLGAMWNVTIAPKLSMNFRTYLKNIIKNDVKWQKMGPNNKEILVFNKPKDFDKEVSSYFNFGSAFNNPQYPFINYTTSLNGVHLRIQTKEIYLYDFRINFSVPTLCKSIIGTYKVTDHMDWVIPIVIDNSTNNSN